MISFAAGKYSTSTTTEQLSIPLPSRKPMWSHIKWKAWARTPLLWFRMRDSVVFACTTFGQMFALSANWPQYDTSQNSGRLVTGISLYEKEYNLSFLCESSIFASVNSQLSSRWNGETLRPLEQYRGLRFVLWKITTRGQGSLLPFICSASDGNI